MAIHKMTNRLETDDVQAKLAKAKETDADATRMEATVDKRWPKMMASAQWFTAKAGDFGVKLKILIALYQMLQGIQHSLARGLRCCASLPCIDCPDRLAAGDAVGLRR